MPDSPYATPASGEALPDAPPDHGWEIRDNTLLVSQGAQLPMVDLNNGRTEERMTLHRIRLKLEPVWRLWALIGSGVWLGLGIALGGSSDLHPAIGILPAFAVMIFLAVHFFRSPSVDFRIFMSPSTVRRLRQIKFLGNLGGILFLVYIFCQPWMDSALPIARFAGSSLLGVILLRALLSRTVKPLACRRREDDGWFAIKGTDSKALTQLGRLRESRNHSA